MTHTAIHVSPAICLIGVHDSNLAANLAPAHSLVTDVILEEVGWPKPLGAESTVYVATVTGKRSDDPVEELLSQLAGMGYFPASRKAVVALRKQHPDLYPDLVLASLLGISRCGRRYYPVSDMALGAFQVFGYHALGMELGPVDFLQSTSFGVVVIKPSAS